MPLITSCVDNDESASVTNVRDAKAEELRSKAILNKANAQAAEAQALLTQAMATKAQAETELVRIQAEIAKVQLESERVALEAQKAHLEAIKAQAEVDIKAAALKLQQLAQQMEQEKLQNEIDMAKKQQELLNAIAANNTANRAKLASLLNQIQTSESNIIGWQADIYSKEANIVLLEAKIADPTAIVADQIKELKDKIAQEEALIAAAKEAMIKDSETLEAELAAIDAKYLEVAKEYNAVQAKYYEVRNKINEIQSSDEYQNFYSEVNNFWNTYDINKPYWAGSSSIIHNYVNEDEIYTEKYVLKNEFGDEPEEIVFATGKTRDYKKGTLVANTTVDVEALNKVKATLLQKSQSILDDFNKEEDLYYWKDYFYNEEVGLTSEEYWDPNKDDNYYNKSKTRKEYLDYYTDLLKRAKYEEKVAAAEAKASEVDAAYSKYLEMLKKEQTAYYTWKNSANPGVIADRQAYYEAQAKYDEFYSSEYSNFWNEFFSNQFYYKISEEQLEIDNEISDKKIEIQKIQNEIKDIEKKNKELVDTELPAAKKALETANATLEKAYAGLKEKNDARNAAYLAYVAGGEDPTSELYTKWKDAEDAYTEAKEAYDANPDGPYWTQKSKEEAVEKLEGDIAANNADIETKNGEIAGINAKLSDLEAIEGLRTKYNEITAKEEELKDARDLAQKEWEASVEEAQTKDPTYLAFVEAQKATQEALDAYRTANDELWNAQNEKDKFEEIVDRVADLTSKIENAESVKAYRDAQVEKLFANVEALAAAAADNNKAVEKIIPLEEEKNKLWNEDLRGEEGLYAKLIEIEAEKEAIYTILNGHMDDSEAVKDPVHDTWLVEPVWVEGTTALEEKIAAYEKDIKDCNDAIDQLLALAKTTADDNTALVAQLKRDIEVLKAKIAKEEAVLANLKAEYDTTLAAIK